MENNISLTGEDVMVKAGNSYYVIDALYINEIKTYSNELTGKITDQEIRQKVFPYTDNPFAKITPISNIFKVQNIKKVNNSTLSSLNENYFSCDTGLIILIRSSLLAKIIKDFDYDLLVDSLTEEINLNYWRKITEAKNYKDIALILAPGVNSGFQFEGSGLYKIIL